MLLEATGQLVRTMREETIYVQFEGLLSNSIKDFLCLYGMVVDNNTDREEIYTIVSDRITNVSGKFGFKKCSCFEKQQEHIFWHFLESVLLI